MRSSHRLALALGISFLTTFAAAAPAEAKAARVRGYDTVAVVNGRAQLRMKVERENWIHWDLHGVTVDFRVNGTYIGSAVSAGDGYADLWVTIGATAGDVVVTGKVAAGQSYTSNEAKLLLAIRNPQDRIVIVDIDHTISAAGTWDRLTKGNSDLPPVRGAVAGIADVAKDATIVYVTARDDSDSEKTKSWLLYWQFAPGPVYFSDDVRVAFSARPYKSATIRLLKAILPNMPAGFGDLETDAEAYHDNGLDAFIFDTHHAGPYPSYSIVTRDWEDLRAQNAAGQRPELSWATSFR